MFPPFVLALLSVIAVSLIAFIGLVTFSIREKTLRSVLLYFVSFAAGAFFGDAFLLLLPETVESLGFTLQVSFLLLAGIVTLFVVEKLVKWHHCHLPTSKKHPHPFAYMNLFADGVHNFIYG